MAERLEIKVVYEDPLKVSLPTLFSNFVGIARAGTEVQFEFVAVDINGLAGKMEKQKSDPGGPIEVAGKTVAKIVVPLHVFMQIEQHLNTLFAAVRQEFSAKDSDEVGHERSAII